MAKIRYFVKGALALFVDFLERGRKTTRIDQILLFIVGLDIGMFIALIIYMIHAC